MQATCIAECGLVWWPTPPLGAELTATVMAARKVLCQRPPLALGQGLCFAEVFPAGVTEHRVFWWASTPLWRLHNTTVTTRTLQSMQVKDE